MQPEPNPKHNSCNVCDMVNVCIMNHNMLNAKPKTKLWNVIGLGLIRIDISCICFCWFKNWIILISFFHRFIKIIIIEIDVLFNKKL